MTIPSVHPRRIGFDPRVVAPAPMSVTRARHRANRATVAELMTSPPPAIEATAPVREVVHRFVAGGITELVVTTGARPIGVITARNLLALVDPVAGAWQPRRARDLVAARTPRLLPDLEISAAVSVMSTDRVEAVPVVDHRGDLIGVVAQRHIIDRLAGARPPS
jgi:CBS domain-containing protein